MVQESLCARPRARRDWSWLTPSAAGCARAPNELAGKRPGDGAPSDLAETKALSLTRPVEPQTVPVFRREASESRPGRGSRVLTCFQEPPGEVSVLAGHSHEGEATIHDPGITLEAC